MINCSQCGKMLSKEGKDVSSLGLHTFCSVECEEEHGITMTCKICESHNFYRD